VESFYVILFPTVDHSILNAAEVLRKLHGKFSANFDQATTACADELQMLDVKIRALAQCGSELSSILGLTPAQLQLSKAAEEVFADVVTSVYLGSTGLDRCAQMVLRRALELGLAIVYLWDLPHLFWGWKECDHDLGFSEMLDHLGSLNYRTFLYQTTGLSKDDTLIDPGAARRIYRSTSNIVHGKVTTHKVLAADGYVLDRDQYKVHLLLIDEVVTLLLHLWFKRFPDLQSAVRTALPSYDRISC
jgi:hypothetical protein